MKGPWVQKIHYGKRDQIRNQCPIYWDVPKHDGAGHQCKKTLGHVGKCKCHCGCNRNV